MSESGSYPVYGGNGLRGYTTTFNHEGLYTLIGRQGALCGNVNIADGKSYFTEHAVAVKANHLNNTTFLYYLFGTLDLGQYSGQSAQPGLAVSNLVEVEAMVPDKAEQKKISRVFKTVDSLITLHQRKYDKLCVLKKAMLDKMFPKGGSLYPEIRFAGFTDPWEQRKLGDILQERNVRTSDFESNPIFSLTIEDGITPKTDRYERTSLITKTEDLFKIVSPNEFVTNPMNLRFGAFGYNKNSLSVCVSGYYDVFSIDNDKCSGFWNSYFKTPVALKRFDDAATGSLIEKRRVKYSTLCQLIFLMPKGMGEKKQIGAFFDRLDSLITLHQRKLELLRNIKKSMLDKMFV